MEIFDRGMFVWECEAPAELRHGGSLALPVCATKKARGRTRLSELGLFG
jgi:hypothetical protein